jgi:hypothetical protein
MTWLNAVRRGTLLAAICLLAGVLFPSLSAGFSIKPGSLRMQALNSEGNPDTRAGVHPDRLLIDYELELGERVGPRDIRFDFSPGLAGSPSATPICSRVEFELDSCQANTQVGVFYLGLAGESASFALPLYNLDPAPDQLVAMGFDFIWQTELEMKIRPRDFGLSIFTHNLVQAPGERTHVELWGVPADHNGSPPSQRAGFMTTPTGCGPLKLKFSTRSWQPGSQTLSEEGETEPFTACNELPFEPSLDLQLTNPKPDSPTGARINLNFVEHSGPDERTSASLRQARIDLPPGIGISPAGAEGRQSCDDAQFGLGEDSVVSCPFASRVGSVTMSTPVFSDNLEGSIYLGRERPGERFRMFVSAKAPGVEYKAAAKIVANSQTGQLSIQLDDLPQFPIEQMSMDLAGGSRALLATPVTCGRITARAHFVSYAGGPGVGSSSSVDIGGCPSSLPFSNTTIGGSTDLAAGKNTDFLLTYERAQGEQLGVTLATTLPTGLSPDLSAVATCSRAAVAAAACPQSSQVGTAAVEVGSGPTPAKVSGAVYLSDGYDGAPFSMAAIFDVKIGPFDLGTLKVPVALRLDRQTGQVILSNPLPTIFEGVLLRFRTLAIDITRDGFLTNPTSCDPQQVSSVVHSLDGRTASNVAPFQVKACDALGFRPKFSLALNQRGKHAKNPELSFVAKLARGQANLKRLKVKFPTNLKFRTAALKEICPRGDAAEDRCRPGARVGTAVADSELLGAQLRGPVYVVQPKGGGFPDLWTNVEGRGVKLQLRSESSGTNGNLITEILDIPDLPLASFTMKISGGDKKNPLIEVKQDPCATPGALTTPAELESQHGVSRTMSVQMKAGCSKSAGKDRIRGKGRAPNRSR